MVIERFDSCWLVSPVHYLLAAKGSCAAPKAVTSYCWSKCQDVHPWLCWLVMIHNHMYLAYPSFLLVCHYVLATIVHILFMLNMIHMPRRYMCWFAMFSKIAQVLQHVESTGWLERSKFVGSNELGSSLVEVLLGARSAVRKPPYNINWLLWTLSFFKFLIASQAESKPTFQYKWANHPDNKAFVMLCYRFLIVFPRRAPLKQACSPRVIVFSYSLSFYLVKPTGAFPI